MPRQKKPKKPPEDHQLAAWLRRSLPDDTIPLDQQPRLCKRHLAAMAEVYFGVPISQDRIQRALAYERTHVGYTCSSIFSASRSSCRR